MNKPFATCRLSEIPIPEGLRGVALAFEVAEDVDGSGVNRGDIVGCGPLGPPLLSSMKLIVAHFGFAAMLVNAHGFHLGGVAAVAIVKLIIKA